MWEVRSRISIVVHYFQTAVFYEHNVCGPPFITQGPHTWRGLLTSLFDRQQNLDMRRCILILFWSQVQWMGGTRRRIDGNMGALQNDPNKCGGELHHRPPSQFTSQTEASNVRLHHGRCVWRRLPALCFIPSFFILMPFSLCMSASC